MADSVISPSHPLVQRFYHFSKDCKTAQDLQREVIKALHNEGLYLEVGIQRIEGGRSGDLYRESMDYSFLSGGYCEGPDGRFAGVYQLIVDNTQGFGRYLSMQLISPDRTPFSKELLAMLNREFVLLTQDIYRKQKT